ncbi:hypothetical protein AB1284_25385 [Bacillus sp. S2(2024)]|uniref:hypothetical protein n=1 Tax=Bacillus sp. S2(2024) TaxID=3162887 RepID=UPI003D26107B
MWNEKAEYNLIKDILHVEFASDFLFVQLKSVINNEIELVPIQFAQIDPYRSYRTSQASKILGIKSNRIRYFLNKYNNYIQARKIGPKYIFSFRAIYKIHLINLCFIKNIISFSQFNIIMSLHVSYNDFVDMRLTNFTNKFEELNTKDVEIDSNESSFYVLYMQLCEITMELIKETKQHNMTLIENPSSVDEENGKTLLIKKKAQQNLFNKLEESYQNICY